MKTIGRSGVRRERRRQFPRVVLLWKREGDDRGRAGEFFEQPLRHPEDVRRNGRRDQLKRVIVETNEEADRYGRDLIDAFNAKAARPRVFVSCTIELVDGQAAQRPRIYAEDARRAAGFDQ